MCTDSTLTTEIAQQYIDGKLLILTLSLIFSNGLSIYFFRRNWKKERESRINERLFKLQDISMTYPFLENINFIEGWLDFKKDYQAGKVDFDDNKTIKYLQYEQYCEMLFNFVADIFRLHGHRESTLSESIALKQWIRNHKTWWKEPLEDHSNHDIFTKKLCNIIDEWVK